MSLYDDEDLGAPPTDVAVGWSRGVKLMQSQLQAKKAKPMGPPKSATSVNLMPTLNKPRTSSGPILAPVIDLKSKKTLDESNNLMVGKLPFQKPERV
jgi:hypothetical protein